MDELYEKAIEKWGVEAQIIMAIEECSELIVAIAQAIRNHNVNIIEEIADVQIMMEQLSAIFGEDEVERIKQEKLERLEQRLNNE